MKYYKIMLVCVLFISYTSCELFTRTNENQDTEPRYIPDIAWTLKTKTVWPYADEVRYGQYLYIIENTSSYFSESPIEINIAKIDLQTGRYVWQSPSIRGWQDKSSVIKSNDNLFIQTDSGLLYCFNDNDGTLRATIELPSKTNSWWGEILADEHYLYWGTGYTPTGLMRFDTQKIDFSQPPTTPQLIQPTLLWSGKEPIGSLPIIDSGIIYALTFNTDYMSEKGSSTLVAIQMDNNTVLWEKQFTFMGEGYPISGSMKQPLYIERDTIYVIDSALGAYNKNTGTTVYEVIQSHEDWMNEVYLASTIFAPGIEHSDGRFYYVTPAHSGTGSEIGYSDKYNKNIVSVDAKNGKYLWGDLVPKGASLGTVPVVINGKCYVLSDMGLRVYNANTGKLLGVDTSVISTGMDRPNQYDNMFIYFNTDIDNWVGLLTAIYAR